MVVEEEILQDYLQMVRKMMYRQQARRSIPQLLVFEVKLKGIRNCGLGFAKVMYPCESAFRTCSRNHVC